MPDCRKYYVGQDEILEWIDEELTKYQGIENEFNAGAVKALSNLKNTVIDNVRPLKVHQYWSYSGGR